MNAVLPKEPVFNARQPENKETVNHLDVVTIKKGEIVNPVTARFYMGRSSSASVVYCCLWVDGRYSGRGQAGGYGYHKESAALQEAIKSVGIQLKGDPYGREGKEGGNCSIHGIGQQGMELALKAIARAAGYRGKAKII